MAGAGVARFETAATRPRRQTLEIRRACRTLLEMSADNVEIARRAVDAFSRRDMVAFTAYFDESVVWVPLRDVPDLTEPAHGHAGMLEMLDRWLAPWDEYDSATADLVALGDTILWTTHVRAEQRERGMRLNQKIYGVLDFRDGKIVLARWFWTEAEAQAAAGAGDADQRLAALRAQQP
ncbi:MAG: hypothetical protein NVSMB51_19830 [Solirubrobacteraceae bacterium]